MQPADSHPPPPQPPLINLQDSNSDLELPRLPYDNIHHLLSSSRQLYRETSSSARTMSSIADDSSLDESVSSIGAEGWEAVDRLGADEESDYPEEAISRIATPVIDDLQQSVAVLTPPDSDVDATSASKPEEEEQDAQTPIAKAPLDVSFLQAHSEVLFTESLELTAAGRDQDAVASLTAIGGGTARKYVEGSAWTDLENVAGSIKMRLAAIPLLLDRPLRLFYVGAPDSQDEIEAKIGSALIAGQGDNIPRRRRRSILPVSLSKESPQVELIPDTGANMEIETCVEANHSPDGHETLKVVMDSGTVFNSSYDRDSKIYKVDRPDWLPDVAVILVPDDEEQSKSLRLRARQFLTRHAVPTILITSNSKWQAPSRPLTIDHRSPHLIVHIPGTSLSESAVLKRLPVDIDTFLSINSLQLSRCLASMTAGSRAQYGSQSSLARMFSSSDTLSGGKPASFMGSLWRTFNWGIYLVMISLVFGLGRHMLAPNNTGISLEHAEVTAPAITSASISAISTKSVIAQSALSEVVRDEVPYSKRPFEAEPLGDNMILVKAPQWFLNRQGTPKLKIVTSRNSEMIEHEVKQLSKTQGFVVTVPWEEAYGTITLNITAGKRVDVIPVHFGSSAYWKLPYWQASFLKSSNQKVEEEKPAEAEPKPETPYAPKDRLAEDVRLMVAELKKLSKTAGQTLKDSLVALHDERQRIRSWKREGREVMLKGLTSRVAQLATSVREYRRTHYREEQKNLLKLWWKLSGGPSEIVGDKAAHRHCSSRSKGCSQ